LGVEWATVAIERNGMLIAGIPKSEKLEIDNLNPRAALKPA